MEKSCRGKQNLVVADEEGRRYIIPLWMTAPEAAHWGLRSIPRLSRLALSELRDLAETFPVESVLSETGDRDEESQTREAAARTAVRSTAPSEPAEGSDPGSGWRPDGDDRRGDDRGGSEGARRRPGDNATPPWSPVGAGAGRR